MNYHVIKNIAACRECGEIIESKHRHNFVRCLCGAIAVDGGYDYLRRVGKLESFIDMSVTASKVKRYLISTKLHDDASRYIRDLWVKLYAWLAPEVGEEVCTRFKRLNEDTLFMEIYVPSK